MNGPNNCWDGNDSSCGRVVLNWAPDSIDGTYYNGEIHLAADDPDAPIVTVHELGHYTVDDVYEGNYPATPLQPAFRRGAELRRLRVVGGLRRGGFPPASTTTQPSGGRTAPSGIWSNSWTTAGWGDGDTVQGRVASAMMGSVAANTLRGNGGADSIRGDSGNDVLYGGAGVDDVFGGADNDTLHEDAAANGADILGGGLGIDTLSYSLRTAAVKVTLEGTANDGATGEGDNAPTDIENVTGGAGADTIVASAAVNRLAGGAGNDQLRGGGGGDNLASGAGADTLVGEAATTPCSAVPPATTWTPGTASAATTPSTAGWAPTRADATPAAR